MVLFQSILTNNNNNNIDTILLELRRTFLGSRCSDHFSRQKKKKYENKAV